MLSLFTKKPLYHSQGSVKINVATTYRLLSRDFFATLYKFYVSCSGRKKSGKSISSFYRKSQYVRFVSVHERQTLTVNVIEYCLRNTSVFIISMQPKFF